MKKNSLEKCLSEFKGAEVSRPFGPEALVFKVIGKMFALVSQNEEIPRVTIKCTPADGEILVNQFESVVPGYYMNKRHWITISLTGELSDSMLIELTGESYRLVIDKLTRADKQRLEQY